MKWFLRIMWVTILACIAVAVYSQTAEAHGWRHGKHMTAAQIRIHPSWLKMPGYGCYHEDWGTTKGDIVVIPDEELGWLVYWKCVCVTDDEIEGDWDCRWIIIRIVPDNITNARILRILRNITAGHHYGHPKLVILAGGYVFRKHAADDHCHWHNPKNKPAIRVRKL